MITTRGRKPIVWLSLCLIGVLLPVFVAGDDHGVRKRQRERKRDGLKHQEELCVAPVTDPTYRDTCGACHFAYQPGLLPCRSWEGILERLEEHFGDPVDLEPEASGMTQKSRYIFFHLYAWGFRSGRASPGAGPVRFALGFCSLCYGERCAGESRNRIRPS